jgi:hypothetical protein
VRRSVSARTDTPNGSLSHWILKPAEAIHCKLNSPTFESKRTEVFGVWNQTICRHPLPFSFLSESEDRPLAQFAPFEEGLLLCGNLWKVSPPQLKPSAAVTQITFPSARST